MYVGIRHDGYASVVRQRRLRKENSLTEKTAKDEIWLPFYVTDCVPRGKPAAGKIAEGGG